MENDQGKLNPEKKIGFGPLVGSIVIVLILILGAFYFFVTRDDRNEQIKEAGEVLPEGEAQELDQELAGLESEFSSFENELNTIETSEEI